MAKFLVRWTATFENYSIVEAETIEEAANIMVGRDVEYYQKHLGDKIEEINKTLDSDETLHNNLTSNGYF